MFLNKMKEQLGPDKGASFPHSSAAHYPTAVLTVPGSVAMDTGAIGRVPKQEGGGGGGGAGTAGVQMTAVGAHLHPPHTSQNITVVPVPTTGIMTAGGCSKLSQSEEILTKSYRNVNEVFKFGQNHAFPFCLSAGLVITTPQGALVTPPSSSQSFVSGPQTTTMIVSALHPTNTGKQFN